MIKAQDNKISSGGLYLSWPASGRECSRMAYQNAWDLHILESDSRSRCDHEFAHCRTLHGSSIDLLCESASISGTVCRVSQEHTDDRLFIPRAWPLFSCPSFPTAYLEDRLCTATSSANRSAHRNLLPGKTGLICLTYNARDYQQRVSYVQASCT